MRSIAVTSFIVLILSPAAHADDLPSRADIKALPCKTYNVAVGGILHGLLKQPILEYLKKNHQDPDRVASACGMLDYIDKTCAAHPAYTIEQVVNELIKRKKKGPPLPKVAQCVG